MVLIRLSLMLYSRMVAHKAACQTLSNASFKSRRHGKGFAGVAGISQSIRRLKICSAVLLPALKPAYSSLISSACGFSLFRRILSMTSLG